MTLDVMNVSCFLSLPPLYGVADCRHSFVLFCQWTVSSNVKNNTYSSLADTSKLLSPGLLHLTLDPHMWNNGLYFYTSLKIYHATSFQPLHNVLKQHACDIIAHNWSWNSDKVLKKLCHMDLPLLSSWWTSCRPVWHTDTSSVLPVVETDQGSECSLR